MYKTLKISVASIFVVIAAMALVVAYQAMRAGTVSAEGENGEQAQQSDESMQNSDDSYTYNSQSGDSYTKIARKAVQTYGIDNNVNLSAEGIIFAETNLTNDAGSVDLVVGQEVKISKESVKKYVEAAQKLSDSEKSAWSYYVPFVDFNTNSVGQE